MVKIHSEDRFNPKLYYVGVIRSILIIFIFSTSRSPIEILKGKNGVEYIFKPTYKHHITLNNKICRVWGFLQDF